MNLRKNKKIILSIILIVLISISIPGMLHFMYFHDSSNENLKVYDNDSEIVLHKNNNLYLNKVTFNKNNKTDSRFKLSGMDTLWEIKTEKDSTIKIDYDATVSKGRFKVVLITPDKAIINILEQTSSGNKSFNIPSGESRIKIVGDNSCVKLKLDLSSDDNVTFTPYN